MIDVFKILDLFILQLLPGPSRYVSKIMILIVNRYFLVLLLEIYTSVFKRGCLPNSNFSVTHSPYFIISFLASDAFTTNCNRETGKFKLSMLLFSCNFYIYMDSSALVYTLFRTTSIIGSHCVTFDLDYKVRSPIHSRPSLLGVLSISFGLPMMTYKFPPPFLSLLE